ncbi:MAG: hypothetical protein K6T75_06915 [Acetobacteraceae bacterium]|nr:hypothetical protein [Acetobacteraceae bacterium]
MVRVSQRGRRSWSRAGIALAAAAATAGVLAWLWFAPAGGGQRFVLLNFPDSGTGARSPGERYLVSYALLNASRLGATVTSVDLEAAEGVRVVGVLASSQGRVAAAGPEGVLEPPLRVPANEQLRVDVTLEVRARQGVGLRVLTIECRRGLRRFVDQVQLRLPGLSLRAAGAAART